MATNYKVISQRQTAELTPDSRFIDVVEVTFALVPSGETGSVKVPLSYFTPEHVQSLIEAHVTNMEAVRDL
jgi:hypothetical protein